MKKKENTWSGEEKETRSKKNDRDETLVRRSVYIFNNNQSSRLGCLPDGPIRPNKLMLYFSIFAIEPPIHAPKPP
jgi:hypothetical protein